MNVGTKWKLNRKSNLILYFGKCQLKLIVELNGRAANDLFIDVIHKNAYNDKI